MARYGYNICGYIQSNAHLELGCRDRCELIPSISSHQPLIFSAKKMHFIIYYSDAIIIQ